MIEQGLFAARARRFAGVVVVLAGSSWAPAAWAQGAAPKASPAPSSADLAAAKRHYAEGEKLYKSGDYDGALADFRAADDVKSTAQAERYIGLCEDALGHYAAAADWYAKFLAAVPPKMSALGDETRRRVAEISAMPGRVHVESNPPGADLLIDGKDQPAPTPVDVELPPGQHTLEFKAIGRLPAERTIEVSFASSQSVTMDLEPAPPPAPPPPVAIAPAPVVSPPVVPPPQEPRSKVPAYVTGALAVAAAGVGTAFGILTLNDKAEFDRQPTTQTADNGDTHALIADMSFGVAITFAVTSIVLLVTKDEARVSSTSAGPPARTAASRSEQPSIEWALAPLVGSRSGGAGLNVRF